MQPRPGRAGWLTGPGDKCGLQCDYACARLMSARSIKGALLPLAALAITVLAGCGGQQSSSEPKPLTGPPSKTSHVVVIVMENKEYKDIVGSPKAPYVNELLRSAALATASYGVTHPSLPNYLALTGGDTFGIHSDCRECHVKASNLVDQLERARISWKAYMEAMPAPCFRGDSGAYVKNHNPFMYYDDIAADPSRCAKVVPFEQLRADYRTGHLPTFVWITPDLCHDTHDCSVAGGDRWLSGVVPALVRALGPNGMLFLTWDEGTSDKGCCRIARGGRIATIVAGPTTRAGARSAVPYDHYSLLRTVEESLGLRPLREAACPCTQTMNALFGRPPRVRSRP
jgi:phosphatidylinositol-3-phosphatase